MPEWNLRANQTWEEGAREMQQHLGRILGNRTWDVFSMRSQEIYLQKKIGYALFGPPRHLLNGAVVYNKKQLKSIAKVCQCIFKKTKHYANKDRIMVAFIFVLTNIPDEPLVPVIRIPKADHDENTCHLFIDTHSRVYKSWSNYLTYNKLSKCLMICPKDGIYSLKDGRVQLERSKSPGWFTKTEKLTLRTSETLLSLGFAGLCLVALFNPVAIPTAPILIGIITKSIIRIGFTIRKLVDRQQHGQTLGLNSQEARGCWVGLVSETLNTTTGGLSAAAVLMTKVSHTACLVGPAGLRALKVTKATVDALEVLNDITNVAVHMANDATTTEDAVQMASSILFFIHAVIPIPVAASVVRALKESQLPTVLSDVLSCVDEQDDDYRSIYGKDIIHLETAQEFVHLVLNDKLPLTTTQTDSQPNFHFQEKEKFLKNILTFDKYLRTCNYTF